MNLQHSIHLRPADEGDIPFLLELRARAMGAHYEALGRSPDAAHLEARVRDGFDVAQVVELEGRPVGLIKVRRAAGEWHVMQLQVLPEAQGRGIGGRLLRELLAEAGAAGVDVTLSVLKVNRARRLYESLGFAVTGDAGDDGYHMRARAGGATSTEPKTQPCA